MEWHTETIFTREVFKRKKILNYSFSNTRPVLLELFVRHQYLTKSK